MEELNPRHAFALRLVAAGAEDQARAFDIDWCYEHGLVEHREEYPGASHWVLTPKGEELLPGLEVFEALSGGSGQGRWRCVRPFSSLTNIIIYEYEYGLEPDAIRLEVCRKQLGPNERFVAALHGDGMHVTSSPYIADGLINAGEKAIAWANDVLHQHGRMVEV